MPLTIDYVNLKLVCVKSASIFYNSECAAMMPFYVTKERKELIKITIISSLTVLFLFIIIQANLNKT